MNEKDRVIFKLDKIVELYNESVRLSQDNCFKAALLDFGGMGIQIFGDITDVIEAINCEMIIQDGFFRFTYKGVPFIFMRDTEKELQSAIEQIKELEAMQL